MSLTLDPALGVGGMLQQMQRMQQQMKTLELASQQRPQNLAVAPEHFTYAGGVAGGSKEGLVKEATAADELGSFGDLLRDSLKTVNNIQHHASDLQTRFDLGDRSVTLADVMISSQKSRIAFETTVQVRNKMVEAYRTISQMQI